MKTILTKPIGNKYKRKYDRHEVASDNRMQASDGGDGTSGPLDTSQSNPNARQNFKNPVIDNLNQLDAESIIGSSHNRSVGHQHTRSVFVSKYKGTKGKQDLKEGKTLKNLIDSYFDYK